MFYMMVVWIDVSCTQKECGGSPKIKIKTTTIAAVAAAAAKATANETVLVYK